MNQTVSAVESVVLGLLQGLTEFIPVSSSAHLNIAHTFFGHPRMLTYDVVLSVGTTIALAWYFRHDWKALFFDKSQAKLRNLIFLSCVPAALLGVILKKSGIEETSPVADAWFNGVLLVAAGLVLLWSDRVGRQERELNSVNLKDAMIVGCSQALALFPGVSRSGATLTAGLFRGMTRESAARFSFLMSLPINIGATAYSCYDDFKHGAGWATVGASPSVMMIGIVASAVSGFWAIGFLLNFLKKRDVMPFVIWRIVVAFIVWGLLAAGKIPATQAIDKHAQVSKTVTERAPIDIHRKQR